MLTNYLLPDILQYVFNLYLFYETDIPKLENIIPFKFDIRPHLTVTDTTGLHRVSVRSANYLENFLTRITCIDNIINTKEEYYLDTKYKNL
jgi:hypothetical protein